MTGDRSGSSDLTDEVLLSRVAKGDSRAMRLLYERHAQGLGSFVNARLRDPAASGDIVQETLLEVWRNAARFEGRSAGRSWIYAIARNKSIDALRKRSREKWVEADETIADLSAPLGEAIDALKDSARLTDCLNALSDAQRSAVNLAFFQGISYREISVIEGISEGTVKSRIHHAKRLLLHCLSRKPPPPVQSE